jgi:hypothetical protein
MAVFAEEQREVRHQLKNEIATLEGRLKLEQSKHDLSVVTSGSTRSRRRWTAVGDVRRAGGGDRGADAVADGDPRQDAGA